VYASQGFDPYALLIDRMDAHGGWIASASDLLRFVGSIDGSPNRPQIINAGTRATMVTPSAATGGGNYAKGWIVNSAGTYWHNGDLPGTASIMIRGVNGWSIAFLTNSRPNTDTGIARVNADLDQLGWDIIRDIPDWPSTDLF
ncbi:MAG: serine hydrolase, partial [Chloroflexia bacterium]|nr:serine hydrolase [Chloroflexia bacterium]